MYFPSGYGVAVALCVVTMICWGSWANTQKLASRSWSFQLFYWDYCIGIVLLSLLFGVTLGSSGVEGRGFFQDLSQADTAAYAAALIGGVVFNIANLLLVAAIDIAGMAVAFPIGIGLALVLGVVINYVNNPVGDPVILFSGVALVTLAIVIDAIAYKRISSGANTGITKGVLISLVAGILMGFFYRFVAESMSLDFQNPKVGLFTPYSAVFVFGIGIFLSSFVWNTLFMRFPFSGAQVKFSDYFKGTFKLHLVGILGGAIWCVGMSFSMIASGEAGYAISYGLGQGATMVAAFWGVFIWKEFMGAGQKTNLLLGLMFLLFIAGLVLIILSRST